MPGRDRKPRGRVHGLQEQVVLLACPVTTGRVSGFIPRAGEAQEPSRPHGWHPPLPAGLRAVRAGRPASSECLLLALDMESDREGHGGWACVTTVAGGVVATAKPLDSMEGCSGGRREPLRACPPFSCTVGAFALPVLPLGGCSRGPGAGALLWRLWASWAAPPRLGSVATPRLRMAA